jgi:hypothetical protein
LLCDPLVKRSPNENGSGHHLDGGFVRRIVDKRGSQRIKWDALCGYMSLHATPPLKLVT